MFRKRSSNDIKRYAVQLNGRFYAAMNFFSRVPDGYYENNDALFLRKIVARNNYLD